MLTSKDILRLLSLLFFFFLHQPQFKGLSFGGWQKVEPCPPTKTQLSDQFFQFLLGITVVLREIEDNAETKF